MDNSASPAEVGSSEGLGLVERLREMSRRGHWPLLGYEAADEIERLRAALKFYADGSHFNLSDDTAWDTVSGEPQNWWCDEAGTATIEDGSIAKMTLSGDLTAEQIRAMDEA